jgi:hypothetical protein
MGRYRPAKKKIKCKKTKQNTKSQIAAFKDKGL